VFSDTSDHRVHVADVADIGGDDERSTARVAHQLGSVLEAVSAS
jgi:hypothetical protein